MFATLVNIECKRIRDWPSFHDEFHRVFQFPAFYGRNMNAWIDCMSSLDAPEEKMTNLHIEPGQVLTLALEDAESFKTKCPEQYAAIVECSAFVNWLRSQQGLPAVLALSYFVQPTAQRPAV
jgi:RNAse (barnase) inhibitor barstar